MPPTASRVPAIFLDAAAAAPAVRSFVIEKQQFFVRPERAQMSRRADSFHPHHTEHT
jgi:hypothetical protein